MYQDGSLILKKRYIKDEVKFDESLIVAARAKRLFSVIVFVVIVGLGFFFLYDLGKNEIKIESKKYSYIDKSNVATGKKVVISNEPIGKFHKLFVYFDSSTLSVVTVEALPGSNVTLPNKKTSKLDNNEIYVVESDGTHKKVTLDKVMGVVSSEL